MGGFGGQIDPSNLTSSFQFFLPNVAGVPIMSINSVTPDIQGNIDLVNVLLNLVVVHTHYQVFLRGLWIYIMQVY